MISEPMKVTAENGLFPKRLHDLDELPSALFLQGNSELLELPTLAFFSSIKCPASLILQAHDLAQELRQSGIIVISGFHAPVEKEVLAVLLGGTQPIVIIMARGLEGMRLPKAWQAPLEGNRLLLVSPFPTRVRRATAETALYRNRLAAALADAVLFCHASPGGKTEAFAKQVMGWGKACYTLESSHNENLMALGMEPISSWLRR